MSGRRVSRLIRRAARRDRDAHVWMGQAWALADALGLDRDPGQVPRPVRPRPASSAPDPASASTAPDDGDT